MNIEIKTSVKGGLPVIAVGSIQPVDRSVGIFQPYVDEVLLQWMGGGYLSDKVMQSISKKDMSRIEEELMEVYSESKKVGEYRRLAEWEWEHV